MTGDGVASAVTGDDFVERVLDLVERIPPGQVLAYGMIAEIIGAGGPRQVGRVMSLEGSAVPWWRVVRADGSLPSSHAIDAQAHYRDEGTPMRANGSAVDMSRAVWQFGD